MKKLIKIIFASGVAIAILSAILCLYSLTPIHIENKAHNTDYIWEPDSIWINMKEGISFGRIDENGYHNLYAVANPSIIILGSSHSEARNVMQNENFAYYLQKQLEDSYSVYNYGISAHTIYKICKYLPTNMELHEIPPKYTIIEIDNLYISKDDIDDAINKSVEETKSYSTGIMKILQKIPFVRVLYHQIDDGLLNVFLPKGKVMDTSPNEEAKISKEANKTLFSFLEKIENKYGTQIIVMYHPKETLLENGKIFFAKNEEHQEFASCSKIYGIDFIDLSKSFEKMYETEHHVPHGFVTGILGEGHLNKYGHKAAANELYKTIMRLEKEGA